MITVPKSGNIAQSLASDSHESVDDTIVQPASVQTLCPELGMLVFFVQKNVVRYFGGKCENSHFACIQKVIYGVKFLEFLFSQIFMNENVYLFLVIMFQITC